MMAFGPIDYAGIGTVVTSLGVLVAACAAAYSAIRNSQTIRKTHEMIKQVDKAVNGKPPGVTTMVEQVQSLDDERLARVDEMGIAPTLQLILEELRKRGSSHVQ